MSSIRTTAEKIVNERRENVLTDIFWNEFTDAIEKALHDERERAAKIADAHNEGHAKGDGKYVNCGLAIGAVIRKD